MYQAKVQVRAYCPNIYTVHKAHSTDPVFIKKMQKGDSKVTAPSTLFCPARVCRRPSAMPSLDEVGGSRYDVLTLDNF